MTLKEQFMDVQEAYHDRSDDCVIVAEDFAIGFADWKDDNFTMYHNRTYYAKPSSVYFDVKKYIGKEKPTKYYTTEELLQIYKKGL